MPAKRKAHEMAAVDPEADSKQTLYAQFVDENGEKTGPKLQLQVDSTMSQMESLVNQLLQQTEKVPYTFYLNGEEITTDALAEHLTGTAKKEWLAKMEKEGRRVTKKMLSDVKPQVNTEEVYEITYRPQAVFKVRSLTRCTSSLSGHSEAVLVCAFSPASDVLATGSGDTTIRLWDLATQTPKATLSKHTSWIQVLAWSPDGKYLASGSKDRTICVWEKDKCKMALKAHSAFINAISWEPFHTNLNADRFVSASKDGSAKVWKVIAAKTSQCQFTLSGHTASVTAAKWGGLGMIYTTSQDRSVMVWDANTGVPQKRLEGHAHWVNSLALNTDLVIRSGAFDHTEQVFSTPEESQKYAAERFNAVIDAAGGEKVVSCSDDHTLFLWSPATSNKPVARLVGHQGVVCNVSFSPDGKTLASASFDKSVKLWNAVDGKFITSLRAHVGPVYHVAWSIDSRQLLSSSKDSTLKLWSMKTKRLINDLPGHADEVFACDWSPDGITAASGSKDKTVRIWRH
eukprot:TRINITY_DN6691_c0_g2_i1.p1 TRINITY_DN6691_c0_g2~~TRINITY_DN6691_c0_g2_i1.p1  ORF type:complete len:514 (+),score=189.01 TRINITY_DN6691_c0_g2_i1:83-1624(+)